MPSLSRLRELVSVHRAVARTLDLDEVSRIVVDRIAGLVRADSCVLLLGEPGEPARIAAARGIDAASQQTFQATVNERLGAALLGLVRHDPEDGFLAVPITGSGRIAGVLAVHRRGDLFRDGEDQVLVSALADQAAIAIEAARSRQELQRVGDRSERLLATIQLNTLSCLAWLDPSLCFAEANVAYCSACGFERHQLLGRRYRDVFPEFVQLQGCLERVRGGEPSIVVREIELRRAGAGQPEYWDWSATAVRGSDGELQGVVLSNVDVTEKVEARKELELASQRKDAFLAMLAHELRNPLGAVTNAHEVLDRATDCQTRHQALAVARRQLAHMARLLDDLLDVSRITRGKILLRKQTVAIMEIVEQATSASSWLVRKQGHTVSISRPSRELYVEGDHDRLVQVVSNLVSNACRYTPPGGHIEIVVETGADWVDLRVRDDGQGIAPDALPHVFELFAQSSGSDVGGKSGLGVGLTLVKELAELHGGRVRASSGGLGAGSEFVVTLPLASTPERSDAQVEAAVPASTGRQHRLLLVEDNDDSRETTVELLRLEGHEVVSAGDGATALNLAREFEPDVVLLDIGLPGMSGVEVARRLRAQSSAVPRIVALSGYGPRSGYCGAQAQAGARQDFDDYLTKPVTLEQLRRALT